MNIMDIAKKSKFYNRLLFLKSYSFFVTVCHFDQFSIFGGLGNIVAKLNSGIKFQFQWN